MKTWFMIAVTAASRKVVFQTGKRLWAMVVFTVAWVNLKVLQRGGRKQHKMIRFFLVPCCWITFYRNAIKQSQTLTTHNANRRCRVRFYTCGTTFVETAIYAQLTYNCDDQSCFQIFLRRSNISSFSSPSTRSWVRNPASLTFFRLKIHNCLSCVLEVPTRKRFGMKIRSRKSFSAIRQ